MDPALFRQIYPAFDAQRYPDGMVQFHLGSASARLLPSVWGELRDDGIALYVAHRLALAGPVVTAGGSGGATFPAPGPAKGLVSSKSVGGASISYDTSAGQTEGGGDWNLTSYGQQFLTLASAVAVGAMQF